MATKKTKKTDADTPDTPPATPDTTPPSDTPDTPSNDAAATPDQETAPTVPPADVPPATPDTTPVDPSPAPTLPTADTDPGAEVTPLSQQYTDIDTQLGGLYDQLVANIKTAATGIGGGDSPDQILAGAVQFLRQCNATLESTRQLLVSAQSVVEQNNQQLQSIDKAKDDLQKRSDDYVRMTTGGEKNEGQ